MDTYSISNTLIHLAKQILNKTSGFKQNYFSTIPAKKTSLVMTEGQMHTMTNRRTTKNYSIEWPLAKE